jgi:hypothetical protein
MVTCGSADRRHGGLVGKREYRADVTSNESAGRKVLALAMLAVVVAAVVWTLIPFHDAGLSCDSAVGSARHGTTLFGGKPVPEQASALAAYAAAHSPPTLAVTTACRGPARTRLATSGGLIVLALIGVGIGSRSHDPRRSRS